VACPVAAIKQEVEGLVTIDANLCIGCEACVTQCPFGVMVVVNDRVVKCELCSGDPQCVKFCATGAIEFADAENVARQKRTKSGNLLLQELDI
jgi:Fe-S-cluster-containing dehydrogenase component